MLDSRKSLAVLAMAGALGWGGAGCGDDDSSDAGGTTSATTAVEAAPADDAEKRAGKSGSGTSEGSGSDAGNDASSGSGSSDAAPVRGDGSIQGFGEPASDDDSQAAVTVATDYYAARAAGDWAQACALMGADIKKQFEQLFEQVAKSGNKGCPAALAALVGRVPSELREKQAESIRFTGVRVEDDRAFALFTGEGIPHGFLPMAREDGQWKVAALEGSSL